MATPIIETNKQDQKKVEIALGKLQRGELVDLLADVDAGFINPQELKEALDRQWKSPWFRFCQFVRSFFEPTRF